MPEKFPYNLEKAQEEAVKMQAKIKSGAANNYIEAEKLLSESETKDVDLTPEQKGVKDMIISNLTEGKIYYGGLIYQMGNLNISKEAVEQIVTSPEVREAAKKRITDCFFPPKGYRPRIEEAALIKKILNVPDKFIQTPEIQEVAEKNVDYLVKVCIDPQSKSKSSTWWMELKEAVAAENFIIKDKQFSPEIQQAIERRLLEKMSRDVEEKYIHETNSIKDL